MADDDGNGRTLKVVAIVAPLLLVACMGMIGALWGEIREVRRHGDLPYHPGMPLWVKDEISKPIGDLAEEVRVLRETLVREGYIDPQR